MNSSTTIYTALLELVLQEAVMLHQEVIAVEAAVEVVLAAAVPAGFNTIAPRGVKCRLGKIAPLGCDFSHLYVGVQFFNTLILRDCTL